MTQEAAVYTRAKSSSARRRFVVVAGKQIFVDGEGGTKREGEGAGRTSERARESKREEERERGRGFYSSRGAAL